MPYCPECRSEFNEEVETCVECNKKLVKKLPPEIKWVTAHICTVENEAYLIQGFLESMDIPCVIESKKFHAEPVNFGPLSEIEIHVPSEKKEEAIRLIKEKEEGE